MPNFYTSVINDSSVEQDREGRNFASVDAAVADAGRAATALLQEHLGGGAPSASFKLFVHDEEHRRVATISVMGAIVR